MSLFLSLAILRNSSSSNGSSLALNEYISTFPVSPGTCPKCERVVTKGHATHLENCLGRTKRSHSIREYTLAELIQIEAQKIETEEKKLQELDLGGLIDLNDEQATFMVVGSTGTCSCYYLNITSGCSSGARLRTVV